MSRPKSVSASKKQNSGMQKYCSDFTRSKRIRAKQNGKNIQLPRYTTNARFSNTVRQAQQPQQTQTQGLYQQEHSTKETRWAQLKKIQTER